MLLCVALLGGCTLIDQRTFERAGAGPDAVDVARAKGLPALPLVTVRFDNPDADINPVIVQAVEAAQAIKRDVDFDVVAPIPTKATQAVQDAFARQGAIDTARVANAFGYAGVLLDHVHIGYRGDPGNPPREVLVYVR